ncbi:MAG TPA: GNAT family N-acetyltransferase [Firmicutes bacterium]|nr:GNAT family N-acetyltransferase [Bacillota bacterium]
MDNMLAFESLSPAHLDLAAALWADPEVMRYTAIGRPLTADEAADRLEELLRTQDSLAFPTLFAVMYKGTRCGLVGCLPVDPDGGTYGLFYQVQRDTWGKGVGGSSARWLLSYMQQKCRPLTLLADVMAGNTASLRILESLGFQKTAEEPVEGGMRIHYRLDGNGADDK